MTKLSIVVTPDEGEPFSLPVAKSPFLIGRDEAADLVLKGNNVSRRHAEVSVSGESVMVRDYSSTGAFISGVRLPKGRSVPWHAGEPLRIGDYLLELDQPLLRIKRRMEEAASALGQVEIDSGELTEPELKILLHTELLKRLDLRWIDQSARPRHELTMEIHEKIMEMIDEFEDFPAGIDARELARQLTNDVVGLGPLEDLLADPEISEIMVVSEDLIYVERRGKIEKTNIYFTSRDILMAVIERIVSSVGKRVDESSPLVDARLHDGSRVNAVIPPVAIKGPCLTIRKFSQNPLTVEDLIGYGSMTAPMAEFLRCTVLGRRNVIISGGTGSGKTTLLNVLSGFIPERERVVTIEDSAELRLTQPHVITMEAKPPNIEGKGAITIRDLVKNALRMRPDRIVVGECRGGETLDMLQAMNTGHNGSLTTLHANNPSEAIARIETMVLMSGMDLPISAIRDQICSAVHLIVQQNRFPDGSRKVTHITEVLGMDEEGYIKMENVFVFEQRGYDEQGRIRGEMAPTGYIPTFVKDFVHMGIDIPEHIFKV